MKAVLKTSKWLDAYGKSVFWSLACLVLFVTSFYIYLVNTTALNGVRWGSARREMASIEASVSELESQFLSLKRTITIALAYERGFEDIKVVKFISTEKVGIVATAKEF